MKKVYQLFILFFLVISCKQNKEQLSVPDYDFSLINKLVTSWIDSGYYDGAGLLIARENTVIFDSCFGNYDPSEPMYVASASKWLAAATIASVVDDGKLSWNDPVHKWLPEFTDSKGKATLRQLLSHTNGYPSHHPEGVHIDDYQTLEESVSHIVNTPPDTIPGAIFHYGGMAMQVAGRMAELATGKDWESLFQEKIAQPLNMQNTHFTPVDSDRGHSPMLGGAVRSNLYDYANFLNMIFNNGMFQGKRILSEETIKEMQADQVGSATISNTGLKFVEPVRAEKHNGVYGLGEWREELDEKGDAVLISSIGWAGAYPWIDKTTNTYGFFIAHVNVDKAKEGGFSSLYSSPVLPILVRDAYKIAELPDSVKTGYVPIENGELYYQEAGSGEPVIFIHGHSFSHVEWEPQFPVFAKNYRTVVYDCRGYGRSSMPTEGEQFMHVNDLITLMDSLKIDKAHLVGLSMGGFINIDMLALHQDRILTATIASSDIYRRPGPDQPWTKDEIEKRRDEIAELKAKGTITQKWSWHKMLMSSGGSKLESIGRPLWDMIYTWTQWQPLHIEPRLALGNSAVDLLKNQKIEVPILVLTGEIDADRYYEILDYVPNAQQVILPDAGHVSNLENPEAFNRLVLKFLKNDK